MRARMRRCYSLRHRAQVSMPHISRTLDKNAPIDLARYRAWALARRLAFLRQIATMIAERR